MRSGRGIALGTFDLFHIGHVEFLRQCKELCDWLVVALNTDAFAERYKRKPILNLVERFVMLESCRYVDQVIVNTGEENSREAIRLSKASVILHGDDWTGDLYFQQLGVTEEWLKKHGVTVQYVPYSPSLSTSTIIERVKTCL